jgi:hypothetical protein
MTALAAPAAAAQDKLRVITADAVVYLRADATSAVVTRLAVGTVVEMQRKEAEWYVVLLPPDPQGLRRYGYLAAASVEPLANRPDPSGAGTPSRVERIVPDTAAAQPEVGRWAVAGPFVRVSFTFNRIRGSDPAVLREGATDNFFVFPGVNNKAGYEIAVGQHFRKGAFEFSYARSTHRVPLQFFGNDFFAVPFEGQAVYQRINFDYKRYVVRGWRAQPYLMIGAGIPWFRVNDGAELNGGIDDATFTGFGVQIGPGVSFIAHRHLAVHVGAIYRYDLYLSVRGGGRDWVDLLDKLNLRGLNMTSGVSFLF